MADDKLNAAIATAKTGNKVLARQLFSEYLRENPSNEMGWLWLYACVDTVDQKRYCLNQALNINPDNQNTKKALAQLDESKIVQNNREPAGNAQAQHPRPSSITENCPECGKLREIGASFCASCGYSFNKGQNTTKLGPTNVRHDKKTTSQAFSKQVAKNPWWPIGVLLLALPICCIFFVLMLTGIGMVTGNSQLSNLWSNLVSLLFTLLSTMVFWMVMLCVFFVLLQIIIGFGYLIWRNRTTIQVRGTNAQPEQPVLPPSLVQPKPTNPIIPIPEPVENLPRQPIISNQPASYPHQPGNYQDPVSAKPYPYTSTSTKTKFSPKRIITAVGMFLIIISVFANWTVTTSGWRVTSTPGFNTLEGLIAAAFGILGMIVLFGIDRESAAHMFSSLCALIAIASAAIYLSSANSFIDIWDGADIYNRAGVGIYMSIFGAIIALGCLFIPSRD